MESEVGRKCEEHPDLFDCPEHMSTSPQSLENIWNPDSRRRLLVLCDRLFPWCGNQLPRSRRQTGEIGEGKG